MCAQGVSLPGCVRNGLMLKVLDGETENSLRRWEKPWCRQNKTVRVAVLQAFSSDFLISTPGRGISSGPCCPVLFIVCSIGRRMYGCERLDSAISLPISGMAKQHKRDTGGNGPASLSAENKLFVPECSGCLSHQAGDPLTASMPGVKSSQPGAGPNLKFIVRQDTAQLLQKVLGLSLGPIPRSCYRSVFLSFFNSAQSNCFRGGGLSVWFILVAA